MLFASSYSINSYNAVVDPRHLIEVKKKIFTIVSRINGLFLVVKPHPAENVHQIRRLVHGYQNVLIADQLADIRELIPACDAFITMGSTATMDALIARKLVIFPNFPGLVWWDDVYLKNNVAVVASSEEELERIFRAIISGKSRQLLDELESARQRFIKEWIYQPDGRAAVRIADLATQMAGLS